MLWLIFSSFQLLGNLTTSSWGKICKFGTVMIINEAVG
uniref:Uncharacterized protein n=1 Tax=Rhizophora mucronata TaxID=61149 RepID=A0A2P2R3F7_RHIMU